mmetsp:Transcript_13880/g.43988  ORF Transcript_13880/g.43988 Transcript_13880/m.43988 type:complete len:306 (+) Transcript_13880:330-1247(+)
MPAIRRVEQLAVKLQARGIPQHAQACLCVPIGCPWRGVELLTECRAGRHDPRHTDPGLQGGLPGLVPQVAVHEVAGHARPQSEGVSASTPPSRCVHGRKQRGLSGARMVARGWGRPFDQIYFSQGPRKGRGARGHRFGHRFPLKIFKMVPPIERPRETEEKRPPPPTPRSDKGSAQVRGGGSKHRAAAGRMDYATEAAGASIVLATSTDERHPPDNIVEDDDRSFWITTGLFPQEFIVAMDGVVSINKIKTLTTNVRKLSVERSDSSQPEKFEKLFEIGAPRSTHAAAGVEGGCTTRRAGAGLAP